MNIELRSYDAPADLPEDEALERIAFFSEDYLPKNFRSMIMHELNKGRTVVLRLVDDEDGVVVEMRPSANG